LSLNKGSTNITAAPLEAWSGPEGSRKLRFPDFMTTAQDGGRVNKDHRLRNFSQISEHNRSSDCATPANLTPLAFVTLNKL
jgi:hypothetical protein